MSICESFWEDALTLDLFFGSNFWMWCLSIGNLFHVSFTSGLHLMHCPKGLHLMHIPKEHPMWQLVTKGLDVCLFYLGNHRFSSEIKYLLEHESKTWLLRIKRIVIKEIYVKIIMRKHFRIKNLNDNLKINLLKRVSEYSDSEMECHKMLWKEVKLIIGTYYRFGDGTISKWISEVIIHEDLRGIK